jgi:cytochrome P450
MKETLRLYPVAGEVFRTSLQDFEFQGYHIPAGTTVVFGWHPMCRDPKYFAEPESFRPERFDDKVNNFVFSPYVPLAS